METLLSQIYINYLLSDSNVSLIEVWHNKLFIWKYQGRPTFLSTFGLEFQHPLYYRVNEYKQLSKKYHPDLSNSKSSRVLSGLIQTGINNIREILEIQNRGYDARNYVQWYAEFDRIISCKIATTRNNLTRELSARLYDHSKFLQDKFCNRESTLTSLIQEVSEGTLRGKSISDVFKERGPAIRENLKRNEYRQLNRKYKASVGITIKILPNKGKKRPRYLYNTIMLEECVPTPEGDLTFYGYGSSPHGFGLQGFDQTLLSVFVGGPCNNDPSKKREFWKGYADSEEEFIKKYRERYRLESESSFNELL
jgi:hypothetical protein